MRSFHISVIHIISIFISLVTKDLKVLQVPQQVWWIVLDLLWGSQVFRVFDRDHVTQIQELDSNNIILGRSIEHNDDVLRSQVGIHGAYVLYIFQEVTGASQEEGEVPFAIFLHQ